MSIDIRSFEDSVIERGEMRFLDLNAQEIGVFLDLVGAIKSSGYKCLIDVTCVDRPENECRFELVYMFLNLESRTRLVVKLPLQHDKGALSITSIYPAAGWLEREVFDMYGVSFQGNEDLRRILSDYGFDGHPLRKDFPLSGYKEVRYDIESGEVVKSDVNLVQEYRNFDFLTPWEGIQYIDEDKKD